MYELVFTSSFIKDYALCKKRNLNIKKLDTVLNLLKAGETLSDRYRDHVLKGNYVGFRECHISPDWLLIYKRDKGQLVLTALRTGSHADLF